MRQIHEQRLVICWCNYRFRRFSTCEKALSSTLVKVDIQHTWLSNTGVQLRHRLYDAVIHFSGENYFENINVNLRLVGRQAGGQAGRQAARAKPYSRMTKLNCFCRSQLVVHLITGHASLHGDHIKLTAKSTYSDCNCDKPARLSRPIFTNLLLLSCL